MAETVPPKAMNAIKTAIITVLSLGVPQISCARETDNKGSTRPVLVDGILVPPGGGVNIYYINDRVKGTIPFKIPIYKTADAISRKIPTTKEVVSTVAKVAKMIGLNVPGPEAIKVVKSVSEIDDKEDGIYVIGDKDFYRFLVIQTSIAGRRIRLRFVDFGALRFMVRLVTGVVEILSSKNPVEFSLSILGLFRDLIKILFSPFTRKKKGKRGIISSVKHPISTAEASDISDGIPEFIGFLLVELISGRDLLPNEGRGVGPNESNDDVNETTFQEASASETELSCELFPEISKLREILWAKAENGRKELAAFVAFLLWLETLSVASDGIASVEAMSVSRGTPALLTKTSVILGILKEAVASLEIGNEKDKETAQRLKNLISESEKRIEAVGNDIGELVKSLASAVVGFGKVLLKHLLNSVSKATLSTPELEKGKLRMEKPEKSASEQIGQNGREGTSGNAVAVPIPLIKFISNAKTQL